MEGGVHQLRTEKGLDQAVLEPDAASQRIHQAELGSPSRSQPLIDKVKLAARSLVDLLKAFHDLFVDLPLDD
jgi:hypothetical protein